MRAGLGGRGGDVTAAAVFVVVLAALLHLRYGYQAGTNDHLVLSLQGLAWARPGFLPGDWFVASAPQPHVLFDVVTWVGAGASALAEFYLAWWLLGLVAGGAATALLARAWAPRHPVAAAACVAALIGLGPQLVLGSTSPALPSALPHELGGFLGYLAAALLLTRRPRAAAVVIVVTAAVHVQVGALAAVVGVLAVLAVALLERRWWWSVLGGSVIAGVVVAAVLRLRPVAAESEDFVQICHEVIPYHCDATTWPTGQLVSGFAVVAAALLSVAYVARSGRTAVGPWAAAVAAPAAGLVAGVLANRYGVPVAGRLAQTTNVFRLAVLVLPFAAWGLYAGFVRLAGWWRLGWAVAALVAGYAWFVVPQGTPSLPSSPWWALPVLAFALVGVLGRGLGARFGPVVAGAGLAATAVLVSGAVSLGVLRWRPVEVRFVPDRADRAMGWLVARHVPVGETVLVPPTMGVIRLTSGRSIVVDCKAVPYGGAAWHQYRERLAALGGRASCFGGGRPFLDVPAGSLTATALRYDARYLLLRSTDERVAAIRDDYGWRVLSSPYARAGAVWLLAAPGAPDAGLLP